MLGRWAGTTVSTAADAFSTFFAPPHPSNGEQSPEKQDYDEKNINCIH